jgi:hypothetical protein
MKAPLCSQLKIWNLKKIIVSDLKRFKVSKFMLKSNFLNQRQNENCTGYKSFASLDTKVFDLFAPEFGPASLEYIMPSIHVATQHCVM